MITLEEAKNLRRGKVLYHTQYKNADGTPQKWKVNGKPKTWKTMPERVEVPLKYGLYCFDRLDETMLHLVTLNP